MRKWIVRSVLFLLITAMSPLEAQGTDGHGLINDRFRIWLGAFRPDVDSEIAINGTSVDPPPISVENTLGLEDSKTVAFGGLRWRISRRNSLEFEFFALNRDGARVCVANYSLNSNSVA